VIFIFSYLLFLCFVVVSASGPRISGGRRSELARTGVCPLHPVDGRREAPDSNWMAILGPMARREASAPSVLLALLQFLAG
jgi:hypothetical protein